MQSRYPEDCGLTRTIAATTAASRARPGIRLAIVRELKGALMAAFDPFATNSGASKELDCRSHIKGGYWAAGKPVAFAMVAMVAL